MVDPTGIANWSVTHVDWSEGKWHPKAYRARDVSFEIFKSISVCSTFLSITHKMCYFFIYGSLLELDIADRQNLLIVMML